MRKFAILLVLLAAAAHSTQAQFNGVTAELQIDQNQFLPGEDVPVKVRIVNRSGQPVVLGTDPQWITFAVTGDHQSVVPELGEMRVTGSPFTLLSGQTVTKLFNPTPYFDFRRTGRYRLDASIKVPQWKQEIACKPVAFLVSDGVPLAEFNNLPVGVPPPPGVTNAAPEIRRYSLVKVSYADQMQLYFRLTDDAGRILRVFPLARMVDFGRPEAQIDRANNLHVLLQTGAQSFTYDILDPNGTLLARQFHEYTETRPALRLNDDGQVFVHGGRRVLTWSDLPVSAPAPGTAKTP